MGNTDTPDRNIQPFFNLKKTAFINLEKEKRAAFIAVCSAFAFTLFFLMPLDLYLNNFTEFNVSLSHVALPLLVACTVLLGAIFVLFPRIFRGIALDVATLIVCGLTLSSYFQVLFLNGDMVLLTGGGVGYDKINLTHSLNMAVWTLIVFSPLCIYKGFRNVIKLKYLKWETCVVCISIIVMGMQAAGAVASLPGYDASGITGDYFINLSYDKVFELSTKENICVFVTDLLDVQYMKEILLKHPELEQQLDGFTFYENNVSAHQATFPSVTYLLTGEYYNFDSRNLDSYSTYWNKAWDRRNFIDILRENGYGSSLILDKYSTYGNIEHLYNRADNIKSVEKEVHNIKNYKIMKTTLALSFARVAPYYLKELFLAPVHVGFSNDFYEWSSDSFMPAVSSATDMNYYNYLKTIGLSVQSEHNMFTFVHLNSAHSSNYYYNYNSKTDTLEVGGDAATSAYGSFAILNEYFTQMKELGIYDNSAIFIIADHGDTVDWGLEGRGFSSEPAATASLLIKPKNSHGKLERDTISELSHRNFGASILEAAGLPHKEYGVSYFDIINGELAQPRMFHSYPSGKYQYRGRYEIIGDANDSKNWKHIPPFSE